MNKILKHEKMNQLMLSVFLSACFRKCKINRKTAGDMQPVSAAMAALGYQISYRVSVFPEYWEK
ncbi:MAG: hypothetical protein ACU83O_13390 [Gammaproteobacteria bacterium]